jgi:hypothetical protein
MPKVQCPCGFLHNLTPCPDDGWVTIRDREYESLLDDEMAAATGDKEALLRNIDRRGRLYECPECGRIMWSKPGDRCGTFSIFRPEAVT